MGKPTIEEVREHFKNAKIVRCVHDSELLSDTKKICFSGHYYYVGDNTTLDESDYTVLWSRYKGYAEIVEYKTEAKDDLICIDFDIFLESINKSHNKKQAKKIKKQMIKKLLKDI